MDLKEQKLGSFLARVQYLNFYKKAVNSQSKFFDVSLQEMTKMSPKDAGHLRQYILNKLQEEPQIRDKMKDEWTQPEKRLFSWVLLCYLELHAKSVEKLTGQDLQELSQLTTNKSIPLIKYQANALLKQVGRPKWTEAQDRLLYQILAVQKKYPAVGMWSYVSKELFLRGDQESYKAGKNCRERWFNYVNPELKKHWTLEQDVKLMVFVKKWGKKWSKVIPELDNTKSEHMIKNRFHSIIKKAQIQISSKIKEADLINIIIENINAEIGKQSQQKKDLIKTQSKQVQKRQRRDAQSYIIKQQHEVKQQQNNHTLALIKSKNYQLEGDPIYGHFINDDELRLLFSKDIIKQQEEDQPPKDAASFKLNESMRLNNSNTSPIPLTPFQFGSSKQQQLCFKNLCYNFDSLMPKRNP